MADLCNKALPQGNNRLAPRQLACSYAARPHSPFSRLGGSAWARISLMGVLMRRVGHVLAAVTAGPSYL